MHAYTDTETQSRREQTSKQRLGPSESVYSVWHSWPTLILYSLSVSSGWCVVYACVCRMYIMASAMISKYKLCVLVFSDSLSCCCCCTHTRKRRRIVDKGGQTTPKPSYAHSNHSAFAHVTIESENSFATQLKENKKTTSTNGNTQMPTKANNVLALSKRFGPEIVCRIAATIKTNLAALSQIWHANCVLLWQIFQPILAFQVGVACRCGSVCMGVLCKCVC